MNKPNLNARLSALAAGTPITGVAPASKPAKVAPLAKLPKPAPKVEKPATVPATAPKPAFGGRGVVRTAPTGSSVGGAILQWSFSRLNDWRKCPKMAFFKHVQKMKEPGNQHTERGTAIHTMCQNYVEGKLPKLPTELLKFKSEFEVLKKNKALCEAEWAFGPDWVPQTWFSKLYKLLRVKTDAVYIITKSKTARVIDFKTGRVNESHEEQLSLYALGTLLMNPGVKEVETELWYLDSGEKTSQVFPASDLPALKEYWEAQAKPMFEDKSFPCNPGNACRFCWFRKENTAPGAPRNCKY